MIPSGARSHGLEVQSRATSTAPSATSMCCQNPPNERLLRAASSRARIFAWSCAFLLGPVPVVKTIALPRLVTSETWSRFPSRYAPSPRYAHQRECNPGALTIAVNAQFVSAEIAQRNRIRLFRDFFQQTSINFRVSHCFSLFEIHHRAGNFQPPVTSRKSPDLTLSPHTPSIQSYRNVCSSQHRNRAGPHPGSAARRGGPPQAGVAGDSAKVWRESSHAAARFFRGAAPRRTERSRGAEAGFTFARRDSRAIRTGGAGAVAAKGRSLRALRSYGRRIFSRLAEKSARCPQVHPASSPSQGFYL